MGRPSCVPEYHPNRGENSSSEEEESHPRRYPRVGNAFQLPSVPDVALNYQSERTAPLIMSQELPFVTEAELTAASASSRADGSTRSPWSSSSASGSDMRSGSALRSGYENPNCSFEWVEPANSSQSDQQQQEEAVEAWATSLLQWQAATAVVKSITSRGRKARGVKKRRRENDDSCSVEPPLPKRVAAVELKQWNSWVTWGGGNVTKRLRREREDWTTTAPIWIWGDLRPSPCRTSSTVEHESESSSSSSIVPADEDVWKAVHSCILNLLNKSKGQTVYLSQVIGLLDHCRRLTSVQESVNNADERRDIHQDLKRLVDEVQVVRRQQSKLMDMWHEDGVEADALRKQLEAASKLMFRLDEADALEGHVKVLLEWQRRVVMASFSSSEADDLEMAQGFIAEAANHGVRTRALIQLEAKIERALALRQRIRDWMSCEKKQGMKVLANLVRDVQRLKWQFPESIQLCTSYQEAESWADRANIAIRSRLSFQEMKELVVKAEQTLPVAIPDLFRKLQSRVELASEWLEELGEIVPKPEGLIDSSYVHFEWMKRMRQALQEDSFIALHELASEGGRLPVQVDTVQLLQIELEARTWTNKTTKWESSTKRAKLEDMRDHARKGRALRERLAFLLTPAQREAWDLIGEETLQSTLQSADSWLERYQSQVCEQAISLQQLREMAAESQSIPVNLGPPSLKMSKLLAQAETWFGKYKDLWTRCATPAPAAPKVELAELRTAVDAANTDLSVELQEAVDLEDAVSRVETWSNTVAVATGVKSRRSKKEVLTADDLKRLVQEASTLPIETQEQVVALQNELSRVQDWQARASQSLTAILEAFTSMQENMRITYGKPEEYQRIVKRTMDVDVDQEISTPDSNLAALIKAFRQEAGGLSISTPEAEAAATLEAVARWCLRSVKYLENQRDIFDKRFFGAFDRFFSEGKALSKNDHDFASPGLLQELLTSWKAVVDGQLQRLTIILSDREDFIRWSRTAEAMLSADETKNKRPTIEKMKELSEKSTAFPGDCDLVVKLRKLADDASDWCKEAKDLLSSETKMTWVEAKALSDGADKIGFTCAEARTIKNGLKSARSWAGRVKRSKVDQGAVQVRVVRNLMNEYEGLLLEMPEEIAKLRKAVKNYCICRRPYEGFMIGCDGCGEWFHGPCVGVSEARAGKVDKYSCLRCSLSLTFRSSAGVAAGIIRKWTNEKDLKRARQVASQKHQRKVRKENKLIESLEKEAKDLTEHLCARLNVSVSVPVDGVSSPSQVRIMPNVDAATATLGAAGQTEAVGLRADSSVDKSGEVLIPSVPGPKKEESAKETAGLPDGNDAVLTEAEVPSEEPKAPNADALVCVPLPVNAAPSIESIRERVEKISSGIARCKERLGQLSEAAAARKNEDHREDSRSADMKKWCIRVRSLIVAPSTRERALESRPNLDGSLSGSMETLSEEAEKFGLSEFEDVKAVKGTFACMAWALRALAIVSHQPSAPEIESLVECASSISLPDEKSLRTLKSLSNRALNWKKKVTKALAPVPGESKPFNLATLRDLVNAGDDIPLAMPFESRLLTVIEDEGARHCVCGGPSDGRFMLGCDQCEKWFHGHCVNVTKDSLGDSEEWKCPSCCGSPVESIPIQDFHERFDADDMDTGSDAGDDDDVSSKAPKPADMWPPYGLLGSTKAAEALGSVCCAIPDFTDAWEMDNLPPDVQSVQMASSGRFLEGAKASIPPASVTTSASPASERDGTGISSSESMSGMMEPPAVPVPASCGIADRNLSNVDSYGSSLLCSLPVPEVQKTTALHNVSQKDDSSKNVANLGANRSPVVVSVKVPLTGAGLRAPPTGSDMKMMPRVEAKYSGIVPAAGESVQAAVGIDGTVQGAQDPLDIANAIQREILVAPVQDARRT